MSWKLSSPLSRHFSSPSKLDFSSINDGVCVLFEQFPSGEDGVWLSVDFRNKDLSLFLKLPNCSGELVLACGLTSFCLPPPPGGDLGAEGRGGAGGGAEVGSAGAITDGEDSEKNGVTLLVFWNSLRAETSSVMSRRPFPVAFSFDSDIFSTTFRNFDIVPGLP